ncbi:MAG: alpha-L-fucosidase [Bacteroidales bacterium]
MRRFITTYTLATLLLCGCSQQKETYYTKHLVFPADATSEQKVDMASRLVPSAQQLAWQQLELTAFLHFGINTFTGREWGNGQEDPALFDPTALDAGQWVKSLKDAGFKMAILTAKHHDGFCLWPTATTHHSVASSPWKNGAGDVVKELRDACDKYDMKFGVYLSPWDRNASCYGDSPEYNRFFIEQLTELLTNYGEIHEVWFDGACGEGPNGKKQEYDWDSFYQTITRLQPNAVMAIMGDDVRWVGNEKGLGRPTEWSATALTPGIYRRSAEQNKSLGLFSKSPDLGGREIIQKASELFWYPSEVDVSIRPGWFYHEKEDDKVKSLPHLVDIYFQSVGYNSVLLLNIPPDKRGLIHENDVKRLKEMSVYLNETFSKNHLKQNQEWKAQPGSSKEFALVPDSRINTILLQEDIRKGQRVERFVIESFENGSWRTLEEGTTIGYKRLIRFPETTTDKIRLTIAESRNAANISNVAAYYARPLQDATAAEKLSDLAVETWMPVGVSGDAKKAIDANASTAWKANALTAFVVDMGKPEPVKGFVYAPVQQEDKTGTIFKYNFYVSENGKEWTKCACSGEFSNIMHNPIPQYVRFEQPYSARYFKLEPVREIEGRESTSIGEIGILTK